MKRALISRRSLLSSACAAGLAMAAAPAAGAAAARAPEAFPLRDVRLKPSMFADAVRVNAAYLLALEPDRLLHNFRQGAGLQPKGEIYGGWESLGIAGHSLGHYLSGCALTYAQTGDEALAARVRYVVSELAACQAARGTGYVGGTTVDRNGQSVDGGVIYDELGRGEVHPTPFDVNGGWVPIYAWHKVHAGLLDAHKYCASETALQVARGMADHLGRVFGALSDDQMQAVLQCEHGGVNESLAELYARTRDLRYLALAERFYHHAVLDPLAAQRDQLAGLHANTQIPKLIGLARLHELTGSEAHGTAARFFWDTVTSQHSYVIGGNSEKEHFAARGVAAGLLTDRTCESCNSYNMLRLTRHLWAWRPDSAYFDYFERAHLNHIMAHQHPDTGMKVYFMPLSAGGRRQYSTPTDNFWCCVGTGMESHAKHGESIYWRAGDTLYVNLFIPSTLTWSERGARVDLDTAYPNGETVNVTVTDAGRLGRSAVAMRLPGWCATPQLAVNGRATTFERQNGYAMVRRRWRSGDTLTLTLPMSVRVEAAPDDAQTLAFLSGPLVLAADVGDAAKPLSAPIPALREGAALAGITRVPGRPHEYQISTHETPITLSPYYALYERRTAPYLQQISDAAWAERRSAFADQQARQAALDARTVDFLQLGEAASEQAHNYRARHDDLFSYAGIAGRQANWGTGNYVEADLAVMSGGLVLQALYWGEEIDKNFAVKVDGQVIAHERRPGPAVAAWVAEDYPLDRNLTRGKASIRVRIETLGTNAMVYQLRTLRVA